MNDSASTKFTLKGLKRLQIPRWVKMEVMFLTLFLVYLIIGAFVFQAIEQPAYQHRMQEQRQRVKLMLAKYNLSTSFIIELRQEIKKQNIRFDEVDWSFANSIVFAGTVITTVGYGHIYPRTPCGQAICILYALVGIPLTCLLLKTSGEKLNQFTFACVKHVYEAFERRKKRKRTSPVDTSATDESASSTASTVLEQRSLSQLNPDFLTLAPQRTSSLREKWLDISQQAQREPRVARLSHPNIPTSRTFTSGIQNASTPALKCGIKFANLDQRRKSRVSTVSQSKLPEDVRPQHEVDKILSRMNFAVVFFLTISLILLLSVIGDVRRSDWSYFESFYFCCTTFMTIGFGDYLPFEGGVTVSGYIVFTAALIFGFSSMSMLLAGLSNALDDFSAPPEIDEEDEAGLAKMIANDDVIRTCLVQPRRRRSVAFLGMVGVSRPVNESRERIRYDDMT